MPPSLHLPPLRSWRSTIYAPSTSNPHPTPTIPHPQPIESALSISHRQQQQYESSVTELRRRLARKASTFSLRGKNRRSQRYLRDFDRAEEAVQREEQQEQRSEGSSVRTITRVVNSRKEEEIASGPGPAVPLPGFASRFRSSSRNSSIKGPAPPCPIRSRTSVRMASETSAPPVPFTQLQKIATEACENTLLPATSYVHASTAEWNTTIINTILQQLVKETTTETTQPQYKYIVNSTIIQHANGSDGGRRGMHAASGAYWNNEKDGMWSFKYEAAEGKGLDVVVGIVWVWIG